MFFAYTRYFQHTDDKNDCYFPILVSTKKIECFRLPLIIEHVFQWKAESAAHDNNQVINISLKRVFNESSTLLTLLTATHQSLHLHRIYVEGINLNCLKYNFQLTFSTRFCLKPFLFQLRNYIYLAVINNIFSLIKCHQMITNMKRN